MSSLLSPRRPLANVGNNTLNTAQSKAELFEGPRKTPSKKQSSSKTKKNDVKSATLPKPTLLVFNEGLKEANATNIPTSKVYDISESFSGLTFEEAGSSYHVIKPQPELPSVLKSLSAIVGSSSSEGSDFVEYLSSGQGRRAFLSSSDGCTLLAQALDLAASVATSEHDRVGLLRLVIRLALDGGESVDDCEDEKISNEFSPDQAVEALCGAGIAAAVVLHLSKPLTKEGGDSAAEAPSGASSLQALEALSALSLSPRGAMVLAQLPRLFESIISFLEDGTEKEATPSVKQSAASAVSFLANLAFHEPLALIHTGAAALNAACSFLAAHPFSPCVSDGIALFQSLVDSDALNTPAAAALDTSDDDPSTNGATRDAHATGVKDAPSNENSNQLVAAPAAKEEITCCLAELLRAWASPPLLDSAIAVKKEQHIAAANDFLARLGYRASAKVHLFPAAQLGPGIEESVTVHRM